MKVQIAAISPFAASKAAKQQHVQGACAAGKS